MRGVIVRRVVMAAAAWVAVACRVGDTPPAPLDTAHEACGYCRMVISDARFASQIVGPRDEPKFFDDLGCLRKYLESAPALDAGTRLYLADHRTKQWVRASQAVYAEAKGLSAPMGSHYLAHESPASRAADADAPGAVPVDAAVVFGGRSAEVIQR